VLGRCARAWAQLDRSCTRLRTDEVFGKLEFPTAAVLVEIGAINRGFEAGASGSDGTHRNGPIAELEKAARILEKGTIPAPRLHAPRADEEPALYNDAPDANEPVPVAGLDAENLAIAQGCEKRLREVETRGHKHFGTKQRPNGVRLSCAAVLCSSQVQFYYDGRRQLQPLVRLRTDNRRLGGCLHRRPGGTRRDLPCAAVVMPDGPPLGTHQITAARAPTRLAIPLNWDQDKNSPGRSLPERDADQLRF